MEEYKIRLITAKCPECSADYAARWDELSEEQQCMKGFFCPKYGKFISFTEGGGAMILFRSKGQFLILPTIGFVRDGDAIMLNISWMMFGIVITLYNIMEK